MALLQFSVESNKLLLYGFFFKFNHTESNNILFDTMEYIMMSTVSIECIQQLLNF